MKTVFSTNSELAHVWAQQNQDQGRANSMFFEGPTIYSYGHHFCIARFVSDRVVFFTTRDYSNTTSKHKNLVRRALLGSTVFTVPYGVEDGSKVDHRLNLQYYEEKINENLQAMKRARTQGQWLFETASSFLREALDYIAVFHLKEDKNLKKLSADLAGVDLTAFEKRLEDITSRKKAKDLEKLKSWTQGQGPALQGFYALPVHLRVKDKTIETSHGARVSLRAGLKLWQDIQAGAVQPGYKIEHYEVREVFKDYIVIGCHTIPFSEGARLFKQ